MSAHTLTVVHAIDSDDVTLTINHPADAPCPRTWLECHPCPEPPPAGEDTYSWYEDADRHGVEHQVFGGSGCIETNECYLNSIFDWHYPDDAPESDGVFALDYEGGDIDDSYLLIGERLSGGAS